VVIQEKRTRKFGEGKVIGEGNPIGWFCGGNPIGWRKAPWIILSRNAH